MIAIKIDFPAGRWHATAWGSHVNEGIPEWPPSPWRLCRALIAAWHWKHRRNEATLRSLIEKLAGQPPDFLLPEASAAHTRHYMPVVEGKKETKTKVFDTFIHVNANQSLWIRWNAPVTDDERSLLVTLLENLSYMGRAESLVSVNIATRAPAGDWTTPSEKKSAANGEPIRLLRAPVLSDYSAWLESQQGSAKQTGGNSRKKTHYFARNPFRRASMRHCGLEEKRLEYPARCPVDRVFAPCR